MTEMDFGFPQHGVHAKAAADDAGSARCCWPEV
jgi:hypothetical protein